MVSTVYAVVLLEGQRRINNVVECRTSYDSKTRVRRPSLAVDIMVQSPATDDEIYYTVTSRQSVTIHETYEQCRKLF